MPITISISEARRKLAKILKDLESHPEKSCHITKYNRVIAEVKAVSSVDSRDVANTGKVLLEVMKNLPKSNGTKQPIARNHDDFLYQRKI